MTTTRHDDLQTTPQGVADTTTTDTTTTDTSPRRCVVCATALERPRQRLYCGVKCNRRAAMARAKLAEAQAAAGRAEALAKEVEANYKKIKATEAALPPPITVSYYTASPTTSSLPRRIGRRIAAAWHTFCFYLVSLNTD